MNVTACAPIVSALDAHWETFRATENAVKASAVRVDRARRDLDATESDVQAAINSEHVALHTYFREHDYRTALHGQLRDITGGR